MASIDQIIEQMRNNPKSIRYADLLRVCKQYFGEPRQTGGSHTIFKMPWQGDPRINIQKVSGNAKAYQVKQVLAAVDKIKIYEVLDG